MVTWNDLAVELKKASDEFGKATLAFESLTKTYQRLLDYYKKIQEDK